MKSISLILTTLAVAILLSGCMSSTYVPPLSSKDGISLAETFFNEDFAYYELGAARGGFLAELMESSYSNIQASKPAINLAKVIKENKNLVIVAINNDFADTTILTAFKLCESTSLNGHKLFFIGSQYHKERIMKTIKDSGAKFGFSIYPKI